MLSFYMLAPRCGVLRTVSPAFHRAVATCGLRGMVQAPQAVHGLADLLSREHVHGLEHLCHPEIHYSEQHAEHPCNAWQAKATRVRELPCRRKDWIPSGEAGKV